MSGRRRILFKLHTWLPSLKCLHKTPCVSKDTPYQGYQWLVQQFTFSEGLRLLHLADYISCFLMFPFLPRSIRQTKKASKAAVLCEYPLIRVSCSAGRHLDRCGVVIEKCISIQNDECFSALVRIFPINEKQLMERSIGIHIPPKSSCKTCPQVLFCKVCVLFQYFGRK